MSRNIRALPLYPHNHLKYYVSSVKVYPHKIYGYNIWANYTWVRVYDPADPYTYKYDKFFTHVSVISEEENLEKYEKEVLYWCKKKKSCRRQRKNGVRYTKRAWNQQYRAKLKAETLALLHDYYLTNTFLQDE